MFDLYPEKPTYVMPPRIPPPSHRHAAPSGPWPWVDLAEAHNDDPKVKSPSSKPTPLGECNHPQCEDCPQWISYPSSIFHNWNSKQISLSGIQKAVKNQNGDCVIHSVDVLDSSGAFIGPGNHQVTEKNKRDFWRYNLQKKREPNIRIRALFVENISGPVLQMLGTKYRIEPFFFSSSLNWIPARYQENVSPKQGDHITVTLPFIRTMPLPPGADPPASALASSGSRAESELVDTQAPLILLRSTGAQDASLLLHDLLAIHMIRDKKSSTVISYHPAPELCATSARGLHRRVQYAGESSYWQNIFAQSKDPTFLLVAIFWHALYSWDEALETLWRHFRWLETRVISTNDMVLTQELHVMRAHLLHHASLLEDFRKSVQFILDTPNPAIDADSADVELLDKECKNLLSQIERLEMTRKMQDNRLGNVMNLVFARVNIADSKAMKRLSYVTLIFLPGSFVAGIYGMNIKEFDPSKKQTLKQYIEVAISLTLATIWIIVASQSPISLRSRGAHVWKRLLWPITDSIRLVTAWWNAYKKDTGLPY